ncbi:MAG: 3'(2'),5'-bisphosphate nucleotidase CysQ [Pseudonocardiales bacterium]|nr:3'(2'),5'-bisphosphate nucleotidase CysQ [Pseudonocardiales bacterium]
MAGQELLRLRGRGSDAGRRGDAAAQDVIARILRGARPADAVLSEEAADDPARLAADRVWIVDPLDGTREFGEPDRIDWAVHVALWSDGDLVVGAVALPALGEVLVSDGVAPVVGPPHSPLRIAVSRSRPPAVVHEVAERTGAELVPMGSAGYKVCAVVRGEVDAYLHGGGQYEWDSAAPVAVARTAGLHASRLDGSPLRYNQPDPRLPDLVVCRPQLAPLLLDAVAPAGLR